MGDYYRVQYTRHEDGDPLYVMPTTRMCINCPDGDAIHTLRMFKQNAKGEHSTVCGECLKKIREEEVRSKEALAAETFAIAIDKAADIAKRTGNGYADVFNKVSEAGGGKDNLSSLAGRIMERALTDSISDKAIPSQINRGVKVAELYLKAAAVEQKTTKPIDWRDITEEDQREILLEPAKRLLLSDKKFRREILNDPEVRKALLEVIHVESEDDADAED